MHDFSIGDPRELPVCWYWKMNIGRNFFSDISGVFCFFVFCFLFVFWVLCFVFFFLFFFFLDYLFLLSTRPVRLLDTSYLRSIKSFGSLLSRSSHFLAYSPLWLYVFEREGRETQNADRLPNS